MPISPLLAGMPSVTLTDVAKLRFESISFFLMLFLVVSLLIRWIWNSLRTDFPRLPHLSYPKALGLVGLWGLLFMLVLTMISGARELMTPGAWKKDGLTYTLADEKKPEPPPVTVPTITERARRQGLQSLFELLEKYAREHDGRFPARDEPAIYPGRWKTPHASGMSYVYLPDRTTRDEGRVLACEPELFPDGRLVLFTNGEIKRMTSAELVRSSKPGEVMSCPSPKILSGRPRRNAS
ncbi:MAG: hypothetical protein U0792_22650 [Gemmataceae bacterium]